ncbi:ankyrin, partial [Choiromyces venosus 120613-1]
MDHTKYASLRASDGNSTIGNITNRYNTISNGSNEDRQIMQWLSPLEPQNRHDDVRSDRLGGVGNWLLETNEFRKCRSRKDVDPNTADTSGQTPLLWAAMNGHPEVVKILLDRKDVDLNTADTRGQTPLLWAARNEHLGMVKILLERDDID